jgi:hypothetical protein
MRLRGRVRGYDGGRGRFDFESGGRWGHSWIAAAQGRLAMTNRSSVAISSKSFLFLFFKKEMLPFL